jgi:hypothetical protein
MTAVAMPLDKLDLWLQGRTGAAATNLSMLDGFVTAIVAGWLPRLTATARAAPLAPERTELRQARDLRRS